MLRTQLICGIILTVCYLCSSEPTSTKCEPIRVDLCRGLGYNVTSMTNDLQAEADLTLQTFTPLLQFGCSAQLHLFLCSVYVPMCTEKVEKPIGPCRGLCETVRSRCHPVLQGFGYPWAAALNCSKFPEENNHEHMCMEGPGEVGVPPSLNSLVQTSTFSTQCPRSHVYVNRSGKCAPLCDADIFWDEADRSLAEVWLQTWSTMCFLSSIVALLSFLVDPGRLRYPERPLGVLALCYLLCGVGWGVRALAGRRAVACQNDISDSADPNVLGQYGHVLLAQDGLANPNCAIVFLLIYYFGMAASVWWIIVCLCWALAACRRWSHERLQSHSSMLHLIGWGLPGIQTVAVLVRRDVDADELTGICYVGNQDPDSLVLLVLTPQICYLIAGLLCLVIGCVSLWRQPVVPQGPATIPLAGNQIRLRNPMPTKPQGLFKLGVFGALYAIPLACVIASEAHELYARRHWQNVGVPSIIPNPTTTTHVRPLLWLALLKIFMSQIIGVTAIAWVWSPKTLRAWQKVLRRLLGPAAYKQPPVKCVPLTHINSTPSVRYCPAPTLSASSSTSRAPYVHTHRKQHRKHHKYTGSETIL